MTEYTELRERQSSELNAFTSQYMFFAFSDEQYRKGLEKLGIPEDEAKDRIGMTPAGGYILKEKGEALADLLNRFDDERREAIGKDRDGSGFIMSMFYDELANHEYILTMDETEALDALGYTASEVRKDPRLVKGLRLAKRKLERDSAEHPELMTYSLDDWTIDRSFNAQPGQEVVREIYDQMREALPPKMIPGETLSLYGLGCTEGFVMGEPHDTNRAGANLYLAFGTDGERCYYLGLSEAGGIVYHVRIEGPQGAAFYDIEAPREAAIEEAKEEYLEDHPGAQDSALTVTVKRGDA